MSDGNDSTRGPSNTNRPPSDDYYANYYDDSYYAFDDGALSEEDRATERDAARRYDPLATGNRNLPRSGTRGGKQLAGFGDPGEGADSAAAYLLKLAAEGLSRDQMRTLFIKRFGFPPSDTDLLFAERGWRSDPNAVGKYSQYGSDAKSLRTGYPPEGMDNSPNKLLKMILQQKSLHDARNRQQEVKKKGEEQMVKMHIIMLHILMGDLAAALKAYLVLYQKDKKIYDRMIVKKLGKVRRAKQQAIQTFALYQPPRPYTGKSAPLAARAQRAASKYTQYVQLSTQHMGQLDESIRMLFDGLSTSEREFNNLWQEYKTILDAALRTTERVAQSR